MAIGRDKQKARPAEKPGRNMESGRRLAGINVAVAIVAATALLVVANWIGATQSFRANVETLGRHRLSSRAMKILDRAARADEPVILTSIYTSTATGRNRDKYLPRVRDLLDEMARYNPHLTAVNVTTDSQKAELLTRLRDRLDAKAAKHRAAITEFQDLVRRQLPMHEKFAREWEQYPAQGWLTQFAAAKAFAGRFKDNHDDLAKAENEIRAAKASSRLPDYPEMASKIRDALTNVQGRMEGTAEDLRKLRELPQQATAAKGQLRKATDAMTAAVGKVIEATGKGGTPAPKDPSAALDALAKALTGAATAATDAAEAMSKFNTACGGYAQFATSWRGPGGTPLPRLAAAMAISASDLAEQVRNVRTAAKTEVQARFLDQAGEQLPSLMGAPAHRIAGAAADLVRELSTMDPTTKAILDKQAKDGYLENEIKPIRKLLADLDHLEDLSGQTELIRQIGEENIVLVEAGDKVGVVGFDEVWPKVEREDFGMTAAQKDEPERAFNGDTAISSKIFSLADDPMGEVVVACFERIPPPQMRGRMPAVMGSIPSVYLETLKSRLQKANLTVTTWNLADDPAPPEPAKGRPRVLLILPPPIPDPMSAMSRQPLPRWGPEQTRQLAKVVDAGTPAIFLTCYQAPRMSMFGPTQPSPYALNDYLKANWDVTARTDLRVMQGKLDASTGTYSLPVLRWTFLPLSTFTDHPVGKPLKALRTYWLEACPILKADPGTGDKVQATVTSILSVPQGMRNTWATADAMGMEMKLFQGRGKNIAPDPDAGDMVGPFPLAVESSKTVDGKERQVIVLGVGRSYLDPFLSEPIPRLAGGETLATDPPPTGDVDLVINSAYQLLDQQWLIAAGPSETPRIEYMDQTESWVIKGVIGVGWPLVIMLLGVVVTAVRKR